MLDGNLAPKLKWQGGYDTDTCRKVMLHSYCHVQAHKNTFLQLEKYPVLYSMTTDLQDIVSLIISYLEFPTGQTVSCPETISGL